MSTGFVKPEFEKNCYICNQKFTNLLEYARHLGNEQLTQKKCPKCNHLMIESKKHVPISGKPLSVDPDGFARILLCEKCSYIELYEKRKTDSIFTAV